MEKINKKNNSGIAKNDSQTKNSIQSDKADKKDINSCKDGKAKNKNSNTNKSKTSRTKTKAPKKEEKSLAQNNSSKHAKTLGERGEIAAQTYLKNKGYEIVEVNWKCKMGEADIVALHDDVIVFVEVKTRSNLETGLPEDAVDAKKRRKYECIAAMFLKDHDFVDMSVRFDVIGILSCGNNKAMLRHHINAFGVA